MIGIFLVNDDVIKNSMILFGCNWPPPEYGEVIFFFGHPLAL